MAIKRILILDDDPISILISKKRLEAEGILNDEIAYESFTDPKEAISFFQNREEENYYDFLLLDINMPEIDGFQFLNRIEPLKPKNLKVFLLSSSISPNHIEIATQYSLIKHQFTKPLDENNLRIFKTHFNME
ncbi:CheY chemotaxis protein or a CheY-like REC (receiver) domain [Algoriphagus faecimaris]|uniref:CheY chemotaxis protein or a CheY-like REC (Receiver) domain n=1 Tax=Algoriphagus faecimaris TaxID=686796 RepID=A0A1G6XGC8_9BACT|nr:response regulator [Algoriphagus faecimaris]SDD77111.1 CheY chemotaxis protein or a CheY-like REC (receiver) domain [Algoriphagus faecimaris]